MNSQDIVRRPPLAAELDEYLRRLFPITRSITGKGNRETLRVLQEIVPLRILEVPSGTAVYDWVVPDEWNIRDACITGSDGKRIIDFGECNLHVVSYSEPVDCRLTWQQLKERIHIHPTLADAIPYRTSYYERTWGFCVTHSQFEELEAHGGPFHVTIDSDLRPGSLTYGELLIQGDSQEEVILSCYICHPSMANDSLSGVLLTAFLARHLLELCDLHYSYRVVFAPETIGAIAYCAQNEVAMKRMDFGMVITTVGGPGRIGYKQSYDRLHPINEMIEQVFSETATDFLTYPFDVHGSDERQYSSQGFGINIATICRDRYYEYPYYHTSLDDLSFVTAEQVYETLQLYVRLIEKIEGRRIYRNRMPHCEVMLSRHGLYPSSGGALLPELGGRSQLDLILWLLFLCDGRRSIDAIAKELDVALCQIQPVIDRLIDKGILELV